MGFRKGLWRSGNWLWRSGNWLWLCVANCRPPQDVLQAYWGKVGAFSALAGSSKEERCLGCLRSFAKGGWELWHS